MLRGNLFKKFSKSTLPKAPNGTEVEGGLPKGYMPTIYQMFEDSGLSAENFLKSDPRKTKLDYIPPSSQFQALNRPRSIYNPAYGTGVYNADFINDLTYTDGLKTVKNAKDTPSFKEVSNSNNRAWTIPADLNSMFCPDGNCMQSTPGLQQKTESISNDFDKTFERFKSNPGDFQAKYNQLKQQGYETNPFFANSPYKTPSKKLTQTPATLNVEERNNIVLPSQDKIQSPNYNFAIPDLINLPGNNDMSSDVYQGSGEMTGLTGQFPTGTPFNYTPVSTKPNNVIKADVYTPPANQNLTGNFPTTTPFNVATRITNPTNNQKTIPADVNIAGQTNITGTPTGTGTPLEINQQKGTAPLPNFGVQTPGFLNTFGQGNNIITGAPFGTTTGKDLNGNESSFQPGYGPQNATQKVEGVAKKSTRPDYNSMFTLGLGAIDMGLGYNEDLKNQRILNESIQNRQSKPLYDYNYMYGRTTSGGTEYQPTIKAEMGAQITKRFNTPYGANNVEIEGGEFIQLPDFNTEHAEGPSHEQGGIKTNLPEGTRVYSDHLKPDGSKKTFAQLAKKHDISSFQKTLDDPFKKQVDKDTATIMLKRNQKKLDDLFNDQQSMNGNSNGEMRDGGINNPGFRALPKAVQDQIIANMEYGGYQLPEYGIGGGGTFSQITERMINQGKPGANLLNQNPSQQILANTLNSVNPKAQIYTKSNTLQGRTTPTGESSLATAKTPEEYLKPWIGTIKGIEDMTEGQAQEAIYDYSLKNNPESVTEMWTKFGNTNKGKEFSDLTKMFPTGKISKESLTPEVLKSMKKAYIDNKLGARTLMPKTSPTISTTPTTEETPKVEQKATPPGFTAAKGVKPGNYNKMNFPLAQAIPNVYGLAESQSIFPYAIPEINAPYLKPQTLNIQSQLQDIDNMGTAAVRAGADPLTSYLAGMDAKQRSFQTKQNYDAEGRSKADMFNAQGQLNADQMNASAFNSVYNQMIGQARDAQSAEKQAALANMVEKSAKHDQSENLKQWYFDNGVHSYDADGNTLQMTLNPEGMPTFNYNKPADKAITANTEDKKTKKAKKGMLVSKATSKKSLTKFK